ncbi:phenylacetate--CoA ligase family protein [Cognatishimia sp. D5M38]|jgi:phenylacetate-CoA ligase|uniref:Phenylacetate--CoA ligase family protein n=1 Tax=Cognatishimia coralii TaxID=3083254 RepID=A0ABU8QK28_9RHOB|nr:MULTISPECIES: phenylacetate--CoA ligase family protein [Roseobacteraceae]MCI5038164.1 phenylacetate--CoA ligase family protein [Donghicola eburneus]MDD9722806.1 phenylacetate--CoA ligase family protein [Sulfitobacter sp. PR48]
MRYRRPDVLSTGAAPVFNPVELAAPGALRTLQEDRLRKQVDYLVRNSAFYQRRFAEAGLTAADIPTIGDLRRIPFTTKQDLRDSLARVRPLGEHLAAPLGEVVQIQASSGTTGSPSYVGLTESDVLSWQEMTARALFACGMRPGDLVLHTFALGKGFVGGIPMFQAVQYLGAKDIPIGADGGADRLLIAARDLRPRCAIGTPNFLLYLADIAKDVTGVAAADLGVERLIVGGEPGGGIPAIREALEAAWGATCCEVLGGTDLGCTYWAESDSQIGMHMVGPDHILAELIDPETEELLPYEQGVEGELVYSALTRQASPVLRFRSGDHVIVTSASGADGRPGPTIRCVGRTDDMLIVRGVNLFPSSVQEIIAAIPETNGTMRIVADFAGHSTQGNLKVLVERGPGRDAAEDTALAAAAEARIRNALAVKADVTIVPTDFFSKPGALKVALTLREMPDLPGEAR